MKAEIKNLQIYHSCNLARVAKSFDRLQKFLEDFSLFIKTMLPYCLKCRKNTEIKNPQVPSTKSIRIIFYQNVQFGIVKNQHLLNSKKPVDY